MARATVDRLPPSTVWISWCDGCGAPDYAFASKPKSKSEAAGCPRCGTGHEYMKFAGPYEHKGPSKVLEAAIALLALLDSPVVHVEAADEDTTKKLGDAMCVFRFVVKKAGGQA